MELPTEVPVMTLPNAILFPQAFLPLYIFEPRYQRMLKESLEHASDVHSGDATTGPAARETIRSGGVGANPGLGIASGWTSNLVLQGIARVELAEVVRYRPYRVQRIRPLTSEMTDSVAVEALTMKVLEIVSGGCSERQSDGPAVGTIAGNCGGWRRRRRSPIPGSR
jgi:ATP-dependent Lon protease